ncbi:hypothetical protein PsorP6_016479 [Peronosclerospora sorghi]|uniref:Uncharacterized protein n=1 Tax=Peronosclerospora sorghi TaxID=230839 RepID=A0ACC0VQQ8_9STRA|nr:hypothetical protein PsorP6_016479 [Peronosclerospora sorghi]
MELLFVFLVVASTLCQSEGLALAVDKFNLTNASECQRHLRAAVQPLTSAVFEPVFKGLPFNYDAFKAVMSEKLKKFTLPKVLEQKKRPRYVSFDDPGFMSLFSDEFKADVSSNVDKDWHEIIYYLAVLEVADGSTWKAASLINRAMNKNYFVDKETAAKMERGQFFFVPSCRIS